MRTGTKGSLVTILRNRDKTLNSSPKALQVFEGHHFRYCIRLVLHDHDTDSPLIHSHKPPLNSNSSSVMLLMAVRRNQLLVHQHLSKGVIKRIFSVSWSQCRFKLSFRRDDVRGLALCCYATATAKTLTTQYMVRFSHLTVQLPSVAVSQ